MQTQAEQHAVAIAIVKPHDHNTIARVDFGDDHPFSRDLAGGGMSVRRWRQDRIYIRLSGDRLTKNGWNARQMCHGVFMHGRCVMACSCTATE